MEAIIALRCPINEHLGSIYRLARKVVVTMPVMPLFTYHP
jgi:hypothetical protein